MTDPTPAQSRSNGQAAGIPVGGVGTGYFEANRRGHLSNFAINNNRFADSIISRVPGTFLGFRVAHENGIAAGILQQETGLPFDAAGIRNPCTDKRFFEWTPLYPCAHYRLMNLNLPVGMTWRLLSPVIPFDTEASGLPAAMVQMEFANSTDTACEISGLFSWENIRGRTGNSDTGRRGVIERCLLREHDRFSAVSNFYRELELEHGDDEVFPIGLQFGFHEPVRANPEGDYTLVCIPRPDTPISYQTYDPQDPESLKAFWTQFARSGELNNRVYQDNGAQCGAICQTKVLEPGERYRLGFVVAWNCPRYELGGRDLGNAYNTDFENSLDSAFYLIEYQQLLAAAVENWHGRLMESSFPNWYSRMLINACSVLTSNSLRTLSGDFSLFDSPESTVLSTLDQHFYASIGTSVFFPSYAERELSLLSNNEDKSGHLLHRNLGENALDPCLFAEDPEESGTHYLDLYAMYILLIYRNLHTSGRLAAMINQFPKIRAVAAHLLKLDSDGDGLPDGRIANVSFPGWPPAHRNSYSCGLWIAALLAYADIAKRQHRDSEAELFEKRARRALKTFESSLWESDNQYYLNAVAGEPCDNACHLGQLAGSWLTRFMRLRPGGTRGWPAIVFDDERVTAAAKTILSWNTRKAGVSLATGLQGMPVHEESHHMAAPGPNGVYPGLVSSLLAAPLVYQDLVDDGLDVIRDLYGNLNERRRTASYPRAWESFSGDATGDGKTRHVSALSIWHTYYAFQGLFLSVPDKALFIAPNLPEGVRSFKAPLFTPVCLGDLEWSEQIGERYQQRIKISLDSPIHVERIELEMPPLDIKLDVFIKTSEDVSSAEHAVFPGKRRNTVRIELNGTLLLKEPVALTIREVKPEKRRAKR